MKYENWISYRYLVASKGRFLTFLNFVSIAGIAIGVASLIVVIGVMTGFGENLREKIIGSAPHIMVEKETGIKDYKNVEKELKGIEQVKGASPYVHGSLFLESSNRALSLIVRGIDPKTENDVTKVKQYMKKGSLSDLKDGTVIIGSELARYFGYDVGDTIVTIAPSSGMAGEGWRHELRIVGIFSTGMVDFDMSFVLINIHQAQEIFGLDDNTVTGIGVRLYNPDIATEVKSEIHGTIGYGYAVVTWIEKNRNLFDALFLEKWGLFIVLTFMVIIASFNIISTLIVMVTTKVHDIGILKSIGVPRKSIRKIFVKQGMLIGSLGIFYGLLGGFGISYILRTWIKVPQEIYSIDRVPVRIESWDVAAIVAAAVVISYFATIYPAAKAANLEPVDALRYE